MTKIIPREHGAIIIEKNTYRVSDVFEVNGHFKEAFYKKELDKFYERRNTKCEHLRIYRRFKEKYPTLDQWFQDDLVSRVGRESADTADRTYETRLSYRSRWYIYYLCIFGLSLDYSYLFSLRSICGFIKTSKRYDLDYGFVDLQHGMQSLKYGEHTAFSDIQWVLHRLIMHTQKRHYTEITLDDLEKFEQAAYDYCLKKNPSIFWNHVRHPNIHRIRSSLYRLRLVLYILGVLSVAPRRYYKRDGMIDQSTNYLKYKNIADIITNYIKQISLTKEKRTVEKSFGELYRFAKWLENKYPHIDNLNQLTRPIIDDYLDYIQNFVSKRTGRKYAINHLSGIISILKVFFEESIYFGYQDVPQYKLLFNYHLPKRARDLPRYIPERDLSKLMEAVYALKCPYQKNALILLRWTGARREEIRRLDINALDFYSDGTPKLYIPIGKTHTSRWVPTQEEAASAFRELLEIRKTTGNLKGLPDRKTGKLTDYLFMRKNSIISGPYLFDFSMRAACKEAGLLTEIGKSKYTSHQFRHTIGTQMANRGASLPTIMKMLGHLSPDMTIRYTYIHDETVKKEYQNTIDMGVIIAGGEYADQLKRQDMRQDEIDWIKANFHKTYLMMGHCFHHTREPMCDFADACYFCPKFVTTSDHLPRLIEKYNVELQLIEDAKEREWGKEIDRHTNVAQRVKQIIRDLGGELGGNL
jgi:integrase